MPGQLINCVVQTSGPSGPGVPADIDGTPWIGLADLVNNVVLGPNTLNELCMSSVVLMLCGENIPIY